MHIHKIVQPKIIDSLMGHFPSVFTDELALFKEGLITIQTLPSSTPKFLKPHPVSYHLCDIPEQELSRLQQKGPHGQLQLFQS